jgi:hypothetical protein
MIHTKAVVDSLGFDLRVAESPLIARDLWEGAEFVLVGSDLAGIAAVQNGSEPCVAASLVSSRNGIELSACEVKDGQAIVEVRMPAPELLARFSHLKFLAVTTRAGY